MVNLGCQLPTFVPAGGTEYQGFFKSTTYLAKIALILQGAPDKMLTFNQLMYRLAPLMPEDRKSVEVNIRVCLSSSKCFVKVPLTPGSQNSKKNYWKLDTKQITEKMVRRHFRGILEFFPELASKLQTQIQPPEKRVSVYSSEDACKVKCKVKFSSPFSIESILRRESPRARTPTPSPLSTVTFRAEQQSGLSHRGVKRTVNCETEELDRSFEPSPMWPVGGSTHHGLCSPRAAKIIKRNHESNEPTFAMNISGAGSGPYFSSPHSIHNTYSAPILCHSIFRSWV
ncbi:forkhead box protein H1-like [Boleophthalmus pectinirostris]|uniref:forkhead box protein H1-like n=1 Tax=Boleophthalmus pectinirostris TaxID=150288 RepID=UPI00242D5546|nr:forkhead box protein H1-like [Boleophthalmus pectinirostris]